MTKSEELLREWYDWWYNDPTAPVKMPDALHVRTAVYFVKEGIATDQHKILAERE
ncbi:MAG: hypothetical protein ACREOB_07045 [Thermodesulfobacteriota bacterium]